MREAAEPTYAHINWLSTMSNAVMTDKDRANPNILSYEAIINVLAKFSEDSKTEAGLGEEQIKMAKMMAIELPMSPIGPYIYIAAVTPGNELYENFVMKAKTKETHEAINALKTEFFMSNGAEVVEVVLNFFSKLQPLLASTHACLEKMGWIRGAKTESVAHTEQNWSQ